jgi:hypothetical protein
MAAPTVVPTCDDEPLELRPFQRQRQTDEVRNTPSVQVQARGVRTITTVQWPLRPSVALRVHN